MGILELDSLEGVPWRAIPDLWLSSVGICRCWGCIGLALLEEEEETGGVATNCAVDIVEDLEARGKGTLESVVPTPLLPKVGLDPDPLAETFS